MLKNIIKDRGINKDVLYKITDYPDVSFMGGKYLIFLVKKVENFVRAIYLVTNFLSDNEPLKWRLRTISTELIERIMSFMRDKGHGANEVVYRSSFAGCLSALVSLLNVGEESGSLSPANAELLKREIQSFFPIFNEKIFTMHTPTPALPIARDFKPALMRRPMRGRPRGSKNMSVKEAMHESERPLDVREISNGQRKIIKKEPISFTSFTKKSREIRAVERVQRQHAIIEILKDKKKITSKELLSFMKNCGEKMLQRELSSLVESGVLKKTGEKRWSAYSFVQQLLEV